MARIGYQCRSCKGPPEEEEWLGNCPHCHRPYRAVRVRLADGDGDGFASETIEDGKPIAASTLMAMEEDESEQPRIIGLKGTDWVFDNKFPRVGTILLAAKEGSGKSTYAWQLEQHLTRKKLVKKALYGSAEMRERGLRRQFKRCGPVPSNMIVFCHDDKERLFDVIEQEQPEIVVVDSLHRLINIQDEEGFGMAAGSQRAVTQIAKEIGALADELGFLAILIGHMNNDGTMAGGSGVRHEVDATMTLWRSDDRRDMKRILQFEGKSRFGDPTHRALFVMGPDGLKDCGPLMDEDEKQHEPPPAPPPAGRPNLRLMPREDEEEDE